MKQSKIYCSVILKYYRGRAGFLPGHDRNHYKSSKDQSSRILPNRHQSSCCLIVSLATQILTGVFSMLLFLHYTWFNRTPKNQQMSKRKIHFSFACHMKSIQIDHRIPSSSKELPNGQGLIMCMEEEPRKLKIMILFQRNS